MPHLYTKEKNTSDKKVGYQRICSFLATLCYINALNALINALNNNNNIANRWRISIPVKNFLTRAGGMVYFFSFNIQVV